MLANIVLIYVLSTLALFLAQRWLVFPASRVIDRVPSDPPYSYAYEDVMLPVGDYLTNAWFIEIEDARGVILFSHGNGGNLSGWFEVADVFTQLGFSVLVYDYGGYGRSTGRPSEQRCNEDIRAVWKYLTEQKNIPPDKIVLAGRSIGGGPTLQLASEVEARAVILESTFLSLPKVAKERLFMFPVKLLMRDRFENYKKIGKINAPVMVIHSAGDTIIPIKHAHKLFELANQPKTFLQIQGGHNDGYFVSSHKYQNALHDFLAPLFNNEPAKTGCGEAGSMETGSR